MDKKQTIAELETNTCLARKALALIRDIAGRGAISPNPEHVGYALQEISQVLVERTGSDEILFEPISAALIEDLEKLLDKLELVDAVSRDMARKDASHSARYARCISASQCF